jgi:hypothetical protein
MEQAKRLMEAFGAATPDWRAEGSSRAFAGIRPRRSQAFEL